MAGQQDRFDPQHVEEDECDWMQINSNRKLKRGTFVAQAVGKSWDGAYCLFQSPVTGSRSGRIVLVQLRDSADPEIEQRYTIKRYESEKAPAGDSWRHTKVTLKPVNPDVDLIVLSDVAEDAVRVIAEFLEVVEPNWRQVCCQRKQGVEPRVIDCRPLNENVHHEGVTRWRNGREQSRRQRR